MARHAGSVNINLGRVKLKVGRPVSDKPLKVPDCRVCAHLDAARVGAAGCGMGHELDARACEDFDDTSRDRFMLGGTSGGVHQR